eukprot:9111385-Pyramimonas_sp.AAC.1
MIYNVMLLGRLRSNRMHGNVLARQLACGPTFLAGPPFAAFMCMAFAARGRRTHASPPFPPDSNVSWGQGERWR